MPDPNASYRLSGTAVAKLANVWRASQRDNPASATPDGLRARYGEKWFYGKIVSGGPGTYQVKRQFVSSSGGGAVEFTDATDNYAMTVSATNLADMNGSEALMYAGDYCIVRWDYDASTDPQACYIIEQISGTKAEWKTVVIAFHDTGTAITYDTIEVLVLNTQNPNNGQTLLAYGDCTGS